MHPRPSRAAAQIASASLDVAVRRGPGLRLACALAALLCSVTFGCGEDADADDGGDTAADVNTGGDQDVTPDTGPADASAADAVGDSAAADSAAKDAAQSDTGVAGPDPATASAPSKLTYGVPKPWAEPIKDYIDASYKALQTWSFKREVHDLFVYDGRLYVGYGDADKNLGDVFDVAMRAFTSPKATTTQDEFTSTEEQIERYRRLGDELWVAGVDAMQDGWLGNVFQLKPKASWVKRRTVQGGVHVHDVTRYDGALWAVGSGATQAQWKEGDIYAHLWRSTDDGASFDIAAQSWNNGTGDARWVHMMPTSQGLLVFGYKINGQGKLSELPNGAATFKAGKAEVVPLAPTHPLKNVFVVGCWPDGKGGGVVTGVDVLQTPQKLEAWSVTDADSATPLGLKDAFVIDANIDPKSGETLLLTHDGAAWPAKKAGDTWAVKVWVSPDRKAWTQLLAFPSGDRPTAVAWWGGHLHIGSEQGAVWRALGAFP